MYVCSIYVYIHSYIFMSWIAYFMFNLWKKNNDSKPMMQSKPLKSIYTIKMLRNQNSPTLVVSNVSIKRVQP